MNKSKFKTVKFLPFDKQMVRYFAGDGKAYWEVNKQAETMRCYESIIEAYPELFEVEKAEREFEEGAYYKVRFQGRLNYEVALCRINETNGLFTFTIPDYKPQYKEAFQEIGDKIELKNEL